jgi:hypothetical protein
MSTCYFDENGTQNETLNEPVDCTVGKKTEPCGWCWLTNLLGEPLF